MRINVSFEGSWVPLLICEPNVAIRPREVDGVALQPRIPRLWPPSDHVQRRKASFRAHLG